MTKYLSKKAEILKEPQDKMSSQLALFNRENIYLEAFVLKSKHLKACLGPAFVTVLDQKGLPLALRS